MSLLLPDSGLLFWMVLSFGIVFVILAKYGFPVITRMVEERKAYIDQSMKVAQEANAQLAHLKEESEALIASASKEQGRILREAMQERDKIIADARKQAEIAAQKELDEVRMQIQQRKKPFAISIAKWQFFQWTLPKKCFVRNWTKSTNKWT